MAASDVFGRKRQREAKSPTHQEKYATAQAVPAPIRVPPAMSTYAHFSNSAAPAVKAVSLLAANFSQDNSDGLISVAIDLHSTAVLSLVYQKSSDISGARYDEINLHL